MADDAPAVTAMAQPPASAAVSNGSSPTANISGPVDLDMVGAIEQELEQVSAIYQMVVEFFYRLQLPDYRRL